MDFKKLKTEEAMAGLAEVVDVDSLVDVFSTLIKHGVDKDLASQLVVAESMSMVVAEATDVPMIDMREASEPLLMGVGMMEGSEPTLLDHIMSRVGK